ncbi:hypothetical protein E2C01_061327 [Portunus trituberculatus]|uniref:Uncharacterized protein n=1 Tax=Portunus trituberculatus TaxID=210409 RepID=A0A5B7H3J9_PORTR|nr:hypothetical protein [Portunus trituberculatus]
MPCGYVWPHLAARWSEAVRSHPHYRSSTTEFPSSQKVSKNLACTASGPEKHHVCCVQTLPEWLGSAVGNRRGAAGRECGGAGAGGGGGSRIAVGEAANPSDTLHLRDVTDPSQ